MGTHQPASEEAVIKEHRHATYWLEGKQVRAAGNLILTNQRLVFLRQVNPTEKQTQEIQRLAQEAATSELVQFALKLHKKNLQLPLSSIVTAKMGLLSVFPLRPCLHVYYQSASKKTKTLSFMFTLPFLKRLMLTDFPTIGWVNAIKKAVKAERKKGTLKD